MKRLLILCSLIFALALAGHADPGAEQMSAVVRILNFGEPKDGKILGHTGTGFVISNDGLIMTNNHVVASSLEVADHPYTYIVLQKVGDKMFAYRATFVAQDPDADLAVIRCTGIKATPFQFLTPPPKVLQDVYSLGFPGVADDLHTNFVDLAVELDQKLTDKGVTSLEITDLAQKDKILQDFVVPTSTNGKVERLTDAQWVGEVMPFIQHSCNIRGGNSGGPLLNGGNQVVGVVGDSFTVKQGDHAGEQSNLAIRTSQIEKFLQINHITSCSITDKDSTPPPSVLKTNIVPIIIAASLAVAVALAALLITLFKRRKTGMTGLLQSLKNKGINSGTQLLDLISGRHQSSPSGPPIVPDPQSKGWKLDVRTSAGKTFRIPISEAMFANNGSRLVLGRSDELCDLVVEDETVSRQHADIRRNGKGFEVADRNSSNGTAVNGVFIRKPFEHLPLKPGDTLTVGNVKLDFDRN